MWGREPNERAGPPKRPRELGRAFRGQQLDERDAGELIPRAPAIRVSDDQLSSRSEHASRLQQSRLDGPHRRRCSTGCCSAPQYRNSDRAGQGPPFGQARIQPVGRAPPRRCDPRPAGPGLDRSQSRSLRVRRKRQRAHRTRSPGRPGAGPRSNRRPCCAGASRAAVLASPLDESRVRLEGVDARGPLQDLPVGGIELDHGAAQRVCNWGEVTIGHSGG